MFDPLGAFTMTSGVEPDSRVRKINHAAMSRSDGMLAVMSSSAVSIGVPMEIEKMHSGWGKPVAVVGPGVRRSWSLVDLPHVAIFDDVEDAVAWLGGEMAHRASMGQDHRGRLTPIWYESLPGAASRTPNRAYEGDAGWDLYASEDTTIPVGEFRDVPHHIAVELPDHMWARIVGRSSTLRKRGLMVAEGTIDQGYRGPLYTGVWNLGSAPVTVSAGERISQLIPMSLTARTTRMQEAAILGPSDRGQAGFGSSGR